MSLTLPEGIHLPICLEHVLVKLTVTVPHVGLNLSSSEEVSIELPASADLGTE